MGSAIKQRTQPSCVIFGCGMISCLVSFAEFRENRIESNYGLPSVSAWTVLSKSAMMVSSIGFLFSTIMAA